MDEQMDERGGEDERQNQDQRNQPQPMNFNLDPNKTPVYFADVTIISSNQHTVTLNFAQAVIDGSQQNVVSRVALTRAQAKDFLKTLNDHIEKYEI